MPSLMQHISASSIGPPMMKNASLTPCAFRQRARISLPLNSAISFPPLKATGGTGVNPMPPVINGSFPRRRESRADLPLLALDPRFRGGDRQQSADDFFGPQPVDVAAAQIEPTGEHLFGVLAELRRRR